MPTEKEALRKKFSGSQEIELTVTGRSSGRPTSRPVWFVVEGDTRCVRVGVRDVQFDLEAVPITDRQRVASVVERFRDKYGAGDVRKYYSRLDVAVSSQID